MVQNVVFLGYVSVSPAATNSHSRANPQWCLPTAADTFTRKSILVAIYAIHVNTAGIGVVSPLCKATVPFRGHSEGGVPMTSSQPADSQRGASEADGGVRESAAHGYFTQTSHD